MRLRWPLVALAVVGFLAVLVVGLMRQAPETTIADSLAGGRLADAPGFELEVLDPGKPGPRLAPRLERAAADGRVGLAELRGVPVVLNFWASWCGPCRAEADLLQRRWATEKRRGVLFVGLNMEDLRDDARAFLAEFRVDYPTIREPSRDTARAFGATGVPETYFLTAGGKVAARHLGPLGEEELAEGIAAARSGEPVS